MDFTIDHLSTQHAAALAAAPAPADPRRAVIHDIDPTHTLRLIADNCDRDAVRARAARAPSAATELESISARLRAAARERELTAHAGAIPVSQIDEE